MVERASVVMAYIHHMTGRLIQIKQPTSIRERIMLEDAYKIAVNNLDSIILL